MTMFADLSQRVARDVEQIEDLIARVGQSEELAQRLAGEEPAIEAALADAGQLAIKLGELLDAVDAAPPKARRPRKAVAKKAAKPAAK